MCTRAFTLIELLVVIAIIALLVSLLLPALGKAKLSARCTKDLAHLHALETAQLLYAQDHREMLIDVGLSHGGIGDPDQSWIHTLSEYYGTALIVKSPLDRSRYWSVERGGEGAEFEGRARVTSYGMNNFLSRTYNPGISPQEPFDRLGKLAAPDQTVQFLHMASEGEFAVSDHTHAESWGNAARAPGVASQQVNIAAVAGHLRTPTGISNYGFLDGSARSMPFEAVYFDSQKNKLNPQVAH